MAVGVSSSQSLLVQVGAGYRDQDPDRASSRGRCLLAPGMSYLTHRVAPHTLLRERPGNKQGSRLLEGSMFRASAGTYPGSATG
jgi:hypothetical protein